LLTNAAAIHERNGNGEKAESLYARALEEAPDLIQARRGLADVLYRRGAYEEAEPYYTTLVERQGPVSGDVLFKLGNIAYKRGERDVAVELWRRTVEVD